MDLTDERLIEALIANSRTPMRELARLVGMSAPSVAERVRRLEDTGVIRGFTLSLDSKAMGYPFQAILRINPLPGKLAQVEALIKALPECIECDKVTGEDCFVARICVRDIAALDDLLNPLHTLAETNTAIVKASAVVRRAPPFLR